MSAVQRVVDRLVESDVPLDAASVRLAARRLLADEAPLADPGLVQDVVDELLGLGPLESLLRDPEVADVLVNGSGEVYVERGGRLEPAPTRFANPPAVIAAVERIIAPLGLRLDHASPLVDARLPDGSRLHAAIPPVSIDGPTLAIRRFTQAVADLGALVAVGAIDQRGADRLREAIGSRETIVISGGTGSGKTTLLNVLSTEIPEGERVVTIEDSAELQLTGHVVRLEARPSNAEGVGEVSLRDLVRAALRLRPDRIIIGEVRGPEAFDMIGALNTGHDGSMSTVHANSPEDALDRLELLAMSGTTRAASETVSRQLRAAVDLIVQVARIDGRRIVRSMAEVGDDALREVYP